jgi:formate dehydrogenase maturation protein FdhE
MAVHVNPPLAPMPGLPGVELSATQITAIRAVMRTFVDDDRARCVPPQARMYCQACQQVRPIAGFIAYGQYQLCNTCATEYEVARARGRVASAHQFVREQVFGEELAYALDEE